MVNLLLLGLPSKYEETDESSERRRSAVGLTTRASKISSSLQNSDRVGVKPEITTTTTGITKAGNGRGPPMSFIG